MAVTPQGKPYVELDHFKNNDNRFLFRKEWHSKGQPCALVQLVHGYAEHILVYDVIAEPLTELGFHCFGHDHVGHGQSQGDRVHIDDFSVFARDVLLHTDLMKKEYPGLPIFLVGHSMGGLVSTMAAQVRVELFTGVVLIAPALTTNPKVGGTCKRLLARMVASVAPQLVLGHLDYKHISRNPEIVSRYETDQLMALDGIKARFAVEMMDAQKHVMSNAHRFEVPFLVMQGTCDDVCDPESSQLFHEKARSRDKSIQLYPGWFHSLHNEPGEDGPRAVRDIIKWLTERLKAHVDL